MVKEFDYNCIQRCHNLIAAGAEPTRAFKRKHSRRLPVWLITMWIVSLGLSAALYFQILKFIF